MFTHCKTNFRHKDIWFLFNNKDFKDRCVYIYKCPVCKRTIIVLHETRSVDGKRFTQTEIGSKADNLLNRFLTQLDFTWKTLNIKYGSKANMLWKYHKNGSIYDFNETFVSKAIRPVKPEPVTV